MAVEPGIRRAAARFVPGFLGASVVVLTLLAILQVFLRYLFASPISWVEEVSVMLMIWTVWLGAALLWLTRGHLAVDLLAPRLTPRARAALASVLDLLVVAGAIALVIASRETIEAFTGLEGDLPIDMSIKYYPIPAGAFGLGLAALLNLYERWRGEEMGP